VPRFWYDAAGAAPLAAPGWLGTPPAGVEVRNAGSLSILVDGRTADGAAQSPAIAEPATDYSVIIRYRELRPAASTWQIGGVGVILRFVDSDNYIEVTAGSGASANIGNVRERLVGNSYDTQIPALFGSTPGGGRYLEVALAGGTVRVRGWDEGGTPGAWAIEHTLVGVVHSAGATHFSWPFAAGGVLELGSLAIGTGMDAAPAGPTRVISGTVEDEQGLPSSRLIRAYRRDTGGLAGQTTSDPGTGAFSIPVEQPGEYTVLCLDDEAGLIENDYAVRTLL